MLRRRSQAPETVSVNARFDRMSSADLDTVSESSLMAAGMALDRFRWHGSALDLDEAITNTDQALQALRALQARTFA